MPTLDTLAAASALSWSDVHDARIYGDVTVTAVWPMPPLPQGERLLLFSRSTEPVLRPPRLDATMKQLAHGGVVAVAVHGPPPGADLIEAGKRHKIAVVTTDIALHELALIITRQRHEDDTRWDRLIHGLPAKARSQLEGQEGAVLGWLEDAIGGRAMLIRPGTVPPDQPHIPPDLLESLATGVRTNAALDPGEEGWRARLFSVGPRAPHAVLLVAVPGRWPTIAAKVIQHAIPYVEMTVRSGIEASDWRARQHVSLLQLLMTADPMAAQRAAAPYSMCERVLHADTGRLYLVGCPTGMRDGLRQLIADQLDDAIVASCPVDDSQIIIIMASDDEASAALLMEWISANPTLHLGISLPVDMADMGMAHDQATRGLMSASDAPDRTAVYNPVADPTTLLPASVIHSWGVRVLDGEGDMYDPKRARKLAITSLWLMYGGSGASTLVGISRDTAASTVNEVATSIGLDPGKLEHRIIMDMALRAVRRQPPQKTSAWSLPTPSLSDLLRERVLQEWAEHRLAPIDEADARAKAPREDLRPRKTPTLRETLVRWVECGTNTRDTARQLGVHYKTVQKLLGKIGVILQQPLMTRPPLPAKDERPGLNYFHEVVLALVAVGDIHLDLRTYSEALPSRLASARSAEAVGEAADRGE